jgi:CRP-like cAMP-binding protein
VEIVKGGVLIARENTAGSIYGEMSVLLGRSASATVRTLSASRFYEVAASLELLRRQPELCLNIAGLMARRLEAATRYLANIKEQYAQTDQSIGMVDEVLDAIVLRNVQLMERRLEHDPNG